MLRGQLSTVTIAHLLSLLEPLKVTGVLTANDGEHEGSVHFVNGAVSHAQWVDVEGADALFLLFRLKHGAFRLELSEPSAIRTIQANTTMLLLEGMRQMDMAAAAIAQYQDRRKQAPPTPVPAQG